MKGEAASIGLGAFAHTIANLLLCLGGVATQVVLARWLSLADYTLVTAVIALCSWVQQLSGRMITLPMVKLLAEGRLNPGQGLSAIWRVIVPCSLLLGSIVAMAGWVEASYRGGDPALAWALPLAGAGIACFCLFASYSSVVHGMRRFVESALVQMAYTVGRVSLMIGLVLVGLGAAGALSGAAAAGLFGWLAGAHFLRQWNVGLRGGGERVFAVEAVSFGLRVSLGMAFALLVVTMDVWFVKAYASPDIAAVYAGAFNLARFSYLALVGFSVVLFPELAHSRSVGEGERMRRITTQAVRLNLILLGAFMALVLASPDGLMGLLFGERFTGHPEIVVALCAAMCLFTLWWLGLTALSAEGMGGWVLRSAAGGAFAAGAAMWALVPRLGPLAAPLVIAGVTAGELGLAVGGGWGRRLAGRSLGLTFGRVGVCLGAAGLAARFVPGIGALLVGPTVYLLLLLATGEINQEDRARAMALFPALARMR